MHVLSRGSRLQSCISELNDTEAHGHDRGIQHRSDLKLLPQRRGVALRVHPQQLLVGHRKLAHGDGGLSAQAGLQDGVVDENVLLLEGRTHVISGVNEDERERKQTRVHVGANKVAFALN